MKYHAAAVHWKRLLVTALKVGISMLLIGYLCVQAVNDNQFGALLVGEKNWPLLALAVLTGMLAIAMTILRWHLLMRTLGLTVSVHQSLRAGLLGYVANLLPLGLVAGDSLKSVMVIQGNPGRKTEVIASVLFDRALGLFSLLLMAALASLFLPAEQLARLAEVDRISILRLGTLVQILALLSGLAFGIILLPGFTRLAVWDLVGNMPIVGPVLSKLVAAMRAYRQRVDVILLAVVGSLMSHIVYVAAIVLTTFGIGVPVAQLPAVTSIFLIIPPSLIADSLPVGFYEVTITLLFRAASPPEAPPNLGLLIALTHRLIQLSIGSIGVAYWLAGRGEVRQLIQKVEEAPMQSNGV